MTRPHLSIGEVLALLQSEFPDVTISKIRFLESQGLLDPERTPSGYRKFYDDDILRLRWILKQQRENFLPLKVIKDRLASGVPLTEDPSPEAAPSPDAAPVPDGAGASAPGGGSDRPQGADPPQPVLPLPDSVADPPADGAARNGTQSPVESTKPAPAPRSDRPDPPTGRPTSGRVAHSAPRPSRRGSVDAGAGASAVERSLPAAGPAFERLRASVSASEAGGDEASTAVSMSRRDLMTAAGLEEHQLADLERFGLLRGAPMGRDLVYDEDALVVARLAASFGRFGVEARHLRMYKNAAEREVGFFEQIVQPTLKQRNPTAKPQAFEQLAELAALGANLRGAMIRAALRDITNSA
jgi:DNA-binding transcriptional MerR regulator